MRDVHDAVTLRDVQRRNLLYGIPHVIVGENRTFAGEEDLLRTRGVRVDVVQDERCIALMTRFIREHPELWNEDVGR